MIEGIRATHVLLPAGLLVFLFAAGSASSTQSWNDLMQTLRAFQESRVLLSAIELDIFTAVGDGATAASVSGKVGADPRATESFLNALVAIGALTKKEDVFHNTPATSRYLVAGSPDNQRLALLHTVHLWPAWSTLTASVRAGTSVGYEEMAERGDEWTEAFMAAMHRNALQQAPALVETVGANGVSRLLDIGGGTGAYSITFAQANPGLRAEVLDLATVVPIANKHIEEAGLAARVTTRVGDLRTDEFGKGYDLILLSAICHMLSPEENRDLFRRCHRALAPGGRIVIRDFILEPDKTAPRWAALFVLNMLVATEGGSCYTEQEYSEWLRAAGFSTVRRVEASVIVGSRH